jgi:radical SAM protein with 4Fe4S-binding SPASM domain
MGAREIYEEVLWLVKNRELIFRDFGDIGVAVIRGRRKNSGVDLYINRGTLALLKLMSQGLEYDTVYNLLMNEGLDPIEAERTIINHLEPFVLDISELSGKRRIDYWHPPEVPYPHLIAWELTWRCNLRCVYCYASAGELPVGYRELGLEEARIIIDKLRETVIYVWLGSGEPTVYPHLIDVLEYLRKRDFFISISTNGVRLANKPELIRRITDLVDEVHIPVDGSTPEIHNKLRGRYHDVIKTLREFVKTNRTRVAMGTTITKLNIHDIDNIIKLALDIGVDAWVWSPIFPCGRGLVRKDLALSLQDLITLYKYLVQKSKELEEKLLILTYTPGVTPLRVLKPTLRCGAANYYLLLAPNGDVYPCAYLRWDEWRLGNILTQDLKEILSSPLARFLRKDIDMLTPKGRCRECILFKEGYCNTGCKAMKIVYGLDILDAFPLCTRDIEGSPLNELYKMLSEGRLLGSRGV